MQADVRQGSNRRHPRRSGNVGYSSESATKSDLGDVSDVPGTDMNYSKDPAAHKT
jgi:hypothetical protein